MEELLDIENYDDKLIRKKFQKQKNQSQKTNPFQKMIKN